ncbi:hypothetical protein NPIL_2711 [Nephila pilipes]|uniref:Uncharacterized protein n=1 Tax=Nephila pilipes TaxID=299642 RepID=A0A8X6NZ99_NEPPI|nr:hypothetical protein NPIL_2711 [Nephila pilipes]
MTCVPANYASFSDPDLNFCKDLIRYVLIGYCSKLNWQPWEMYRNSDRCYFTPIVELALKEYLDVSEKNCFFFPLLKFMQGKNHYVAHKILCKTFRRVLFSKPFCFELFFSYLCSVSKSATYACSASPEMVFKVSNRSIYETIARIRQLGILTTSFWTEFARRCEHELITGVLWESDYISDFLRSAFEGGYSENKYHSKMEGTQASS